MGNLKRYDSRPKGDPETNEGRDQRNGLIILQKSKDLMQYLYTSWVKYPKSEKPGFVADYKKTTLQDADVQLELLRLFNDLSYDLHFIDEKRYQLISMRLCEIGRLLGGWIKSQKENS